MRKENPAASWRVKGCERPARGRKEQLNEEERLDRKRTPGPGPGARPPAGGRAPDFLAARAGRGATTLFPGPREPPPERGRGGPEGGPGGARVPRTHLRPRG